MDSNIDLDRASGQIAARTAVWVARGLDVGPLTWRDQARAWPDQVVAGRVNAAEPDSVGFEVRCGDEEGRLVLYAGGWADVEYWDGIDADSAWIAVEGDYDAPLTQHEFGSLLDELGARFRRNRDADRFGGSSRT